MTYHAHGVTGAGGLDEASVGGSSELARRGDEAVFVSQGDRRAVRSVAQVLAGGAVVERHRRHAAGHRLERDVAERLRQAREQEQVGAGEVARQRFAALHAAEDEVRVRSEEHTSELQTLMRISYAVFCLQKKTQESNNTMTNQK